MKRSFPSFSSGAAMVCAALSSAALWSPALWSPALAHADDAPTDAEHVTFAMQEHDAGYAAYKLGHLDEAAAHFENAYFAAPKPGELKAVIRARREAKQYARAATFAALANRKYPADAKLDAYAAETIAEARPSVHRIDLTCSTECSVVSDGKLATPERGTEVTFFLDAGRHDLVVDFGEDRARAQTVEATAGGSTRLTLSAPPRPPAPVPAKPASVTPAPTNAPPVATSEPARTSSASKTWGFVLGGVGIAGLAAGSVFGALAIAKNSSSKDTCDANNVCDAGGKSLRDDARTFGDVSTVAFIAGGALLATGAILLLTAPKASAEKTGRLEATPMIGASGGGVLLRGQW